jgi:hypothetical protein
MLAPILYLDYDGVLHAEDVRLVRRRPCIFESNKLSDIPLFEFAPLLEQLLAPFPELRIVLATSWVRHLGYSYAREQLPPGLRVRVIGATWHSHMRYDQVGSGMPAFDLLTRYAAIKQDAARRKAERWLALDDNIEGWPEGERWRVVVPSDQRLGLAQPGIAEQLSAALQRLCRPPIPKSPDGKSITVGRYPMGKDPFDF